MKYLILFSAYVLICLHNINSQNVNSNILFAKPDILASNFRQAYYIEYLLQNYGNSFQFYREIKNNLFEFKTENSLIKSLVIFENEKRKKIIAEIPFKKYEIRFKGIEYFFDLEELNKYINFFEFENMSFKNDNIVNLTSTNNMLYDKMILMNKNLPGYYWRVLNKNFALTHLKDQFDEWSPLFKNIEAGIVIPYGENFSMSKILTVDSDFESIIYFDGISMNIQDESINKVYGRAGIENSEFSHPTGLSVGRCLENGEMLTYPIYIADFDNLRIGIANLMVDPNNSQLSYFDENSYSSFRFMYPYDISFFESSQNSLNDKLWICEAHPYRPRLSCLSLSGQLCQSFSGYLDSNTNQIYLFEEGTKFRLKTYSTGFNSISFIDNKRNVLVSCLLKDDGTAYTVVNGIDTLILANDLLIFPVSEQINSVSYQSIGVPDYQWPTLWVTSEYNLHNIRMNVRAHTQYLGSANLPSNSIDEFHYLKNTITANNISEFVTIERWSSNLYGIRKYVPYIDFYNDTLENSCFQNENVVRWKGTVTNNCYIYMRPKRLNKFGQWENVKIKKINEISVDDTCYVKWQSAGWNQSSIDRFIDLQLELPIEDYTLGGQVSIYFGFFPEYNIPNINDPTFWDLMHENKTYTANILKTCLPKPNGCPFLYTRNEQGDFEADNNILHRMEFSTPGLDITDKYKLRVTPKIVNNSFDLYIVENENDSGFIDQVRLYAVDYPFNKKLGITEDNKVVLYDSSLVLSSDSIMLNNTNKTSDLSFHNPSASLTPGYSNDSLYAHFPNLTDKHRRITYSESSKQSLQTRAISKNSSKLGPNINYPLAFITNLRNLEYPTASDKDTAGYLTATSIFSNTVSKIFSRRELESIVILPLFADTDKVDNLKIKWQCNFRMKYLGIANLNYSGYTETEIPMTKGSFITLTNDSDITAVLSSDNSKYGMVNSAGLLKMTYDLSNVPAPGINDIRKYVIEVNGYYIKGVNNLLTKPVLNIPQVFYLSQNYPNPFNPITKINYELPRNSNVKIVIYDILGREVTRLVNNELKQAGRYVVEFNAQNYASGVYFYRIEAGDFVQAKKMVLVK